MTGKEFAQKLIDWVSCATQLDPEKDELANVDDWRRNAEKLFRLETGKVHDEAIEKAARMAQRAGDDALVGRIRCLKVLK